MKDKESWDDRPGNWMDQWGACKVCGGEIPHGHTTDCDIYKLELQVRELRVWRDEFVEMLREVSDVLSGMGWNADRGILWRVQKVLALMDKEENK